MATRADANEIRALDESEIDAVGGGAGNLYDLGFGINLWTDGKCWIVGSHPDSQTTKNVTVCTK